MDSNHQQWKEVIFGDRARQRSGGSTSRSVRRRIITPVAVFLLLPQDFLRSDLPMKVAVSDGFKPTEAPRFDLAVVSSAYHQDI